MARIGKRRLEMGEEKWAEYQALRKRRKSLTYEQKNVDKVIRSRQKKKQTLVEYKGGKCERCGLKTHIMDLYDFHHIDPSKKEFGLGGGGKNLSIEKCKEEVDKCMLVCKNCHYTIHYELKVQKYNLR